jgi:hypothetical protein
VHLMLLDDGNIILGGGLNFTLALAEVWGKNPRQDPLESFFSHWLDSHNLIDMVPMKLSHTWKNGRKGDSAVEKCLDHFFYFKTVIGEHVGYIFEGGSWGILRSSTNCIGIFGMSKNISMKFNKDWLLEDDYKNMVHDTWVPLVENVGRSYLYQLAENIWKVRKQTIH